MRKKYINYLIEFKNEHFFLFLTLICSFLLAIVPCIYCLVNFYYTYNKINGLYFLIPFFIVLFLAILVNFIHKKSPILINFIAFFVNIFIIFIIQVIVGYFYFSVLYENNINSIGCDLKYYSKILQYFPQDKIYHFPQKIPNNTKNVQLYSEICNFFGSQEIVLKFDADKQYIQNELKKYKFKSIENTDHYAFSTMGGRKIKVDNFKLYVINGNFDMWAKNYGIGVNKEFNQILYYYTNPD